MRRAVLALLSLALALPSARPAWAQDPSAEDAAFEPERSEDWAEWSHDFARRIQAQSRVTDAIEEFMLAGRFGVRDRASWAAAALVAVRQADKPGESFEPGTRFYVLAEAAVRATIQRLGPMTPEELAKAEIDPRITYTIGRLRFADAARPENAAERGKLFVVALEMFRRAVKGEAIDGFDPDEAKPWVFRTSVNLAQVLTVDQRLDEARIVLQEAHDLYGRHPGLTPNDRLSGQIARGELSRASDERERAKEIYEAALQEFPDSARAHLGLARVLFDEIRLEPALEHYTKAAAAARRGRPDDLVLLEALLASTDICLKFEPAQIERAEQFLAQYEAMRKDAAEALYFRGMIAAAREDWKTGRNIFRRVSRMLPDDRATLVNLLRMLNGLGQGDSEEAKRVQERIRELEKADAARRAAAAKPDPDEDPDKGDDEDEDSDADDSADESQRPTKGK